MVGQHLRHYRIVKEIGAGGMGVVYQAIDTTLQRTVALKILAREHGTDATAQERFLREARAASALTHPNIITVHEINSDRGITFLAMEYIDGETLDARLRKGPLAANEILDFAIQFAEGLAKAHAAGIVHRDLKPGNLMINAEGTLKILDFGLARTNATEEPLAADAITHRALTRPGTAMGTPGYMAPEQCVGDVADTRSDVFSFGVILYKMVTGALPFAGTTAPQVLRAVVADPPLPIETLPEGLPPQFGQLITRCLEKHQDQRFSSAGELLPLLKQVRMESWRSQASLPAVAPAATAPRRRTFLIAALAISAAGTGLSWFAYQRTRNLDPAGITSTSGTPPQLVHAARQQLQFYYHENALDDAAKLLDAAVAASPGFAPAHAAQAELYVRRYVAQRDPQWIKLAEQYARKAVELDADLAASHLALGRVLFEKGTLAEAESALRRALELHPRNAGAFLALAKLQDAQRNLSAAEESFQRALQYGPRDWFVYVEAGIFALRRGRYDQAAQLFEQAAAITPDNGIVYRNLSSVYLLQDRYDEAAAAVQRALEIRPTAPLYSNLGYIRFFQGRYLDAIPPFEKAVQMTPAKYLYWGNLGDAYRWTPGNQQKAAESFTRALQLLREALAAAPANSELLGSEAVYLAKLGRREEALAAVKKILATAKPSPGARFKAALAAEIAKERAQALALLTTALEAGYAPREVKTEPEFTALRNDARYHRLISKFADAKPPANP